jgi:hypothetical protein
MITLEPVKWSSDPGDFRGEIGATLRLDRRRWEALGARFTPRDDGNGEAPGLVAGAVATPEGERRFAVLDYGADSTYLLVPTVEDRQSQTGTVLAALRSREMIGEDDILDTTIGVGETPDQPDFVERLDSMEATLLDLVAASAERRAASVPQARVVSVLGPGRISPVRQHFGIARDVIAAKPFLLEESSGGAVTGHIRHLNPAGYAQFRPDLGGQPRLIHLDANWFQIVRDLLDEQPRDGEPVYVAVEIVEDPELTR